MIYTRQNHNLPFIAVLLLIYSLTPAGAQDDNVWDLSFLKKGAAIGDSYASGLGAGNRLEWGCSRYDGSYSNLVAQQLGNPKLDFTYTACSGANIEDVGKQADRLTDDQEFIIVSAGGNDAGLLDLLSRCVYSFSIIGANNCEYALDSWHLFAQSSELQRRVANLINKIKPKLASGGKIYYVGYGEFFDTSDDACDKVSWHVWWNVIGHEYLTRARRYRMNEMVRVVNQAIRNGIERAEGPVEFVDFNQYISMVGGRYCEPGHDESSGKSANRKELFFYEMRTLDIAWYGHNDLAKIWHEKRDESQADALPANGTLSSQIGDLILDTIQGNPVIALQNDNANAELEDEVQSIEASLGRRQLLASKTTLEDYESQRATDAISTISSVPSQSNHGGNRVQRSSVAVKWNNTTQPYSILPTSNGLAQYNSAASSVHGVLQTTTHMSGSVRSNLAASTLRFWNSIPAASTRPISFVGRVTSQTNSSVSFSTASAQRLGSRSKISAKTAIYHPSTVKLRPSQTMFKASSGRSTGGAIRPSRVSASLMANTATGLSSYLRRPDALWTNSTSNINRNSPRLQRILEGKDPVNIGTGISGNGSISGTVISNQSHVEIRPGAIVEKAGIARLMTPDDTARVFHPTQYGHAFIARVILFQMAEDRAKALRVNNFPPAIGKGTGQGWLNADGAACKQDSTNAWAAYDKVEKAIHDFCGDPHLMRNKKGSTVSSLYNDVTLDYMNVSVRWNSDGNLGEHACKNWLYAIADGCSVPQDGQNPENMKHGGIIEYRDTYTNATLNIQPLSMRRIWDGGKLTSGQKCTADEHYYVDQPTLQADINSYCRSLADTKIGYPGHKFLLAYHDEMPDRLTLSTTWPQGIGNYQIFEEECLHYMGLICNGCDVPNLDKGINPLNWKHGGSMKDNNGIEYKIDPHYRRQPAAQQPRAICQCDRTASRFNIVVNGSGFANSDWGQQSLLPSFHRCGATLTWEFEYLNTVAEDGTEWTAISSLPIGIGTNCVGWAIGQAGGPQNMYC